MSDPTYVLFYVANPTRSAAFYADLLGKQPVENSPGFALFVFGNGLKFGLWKRDEIEPAASGAPGSSEICIAVDNRADVAKMHEDWRKRDVTIAQAPSDLDFGHTFVALDPDGHRLRVFSPTAA